MLGATAWCGFRILARAEAGWPQPTRQDEHGSPWLSSAAARLARGEGGCGRLGGRQCDGRSAACTSSAAALCCCFSQRSPEGLRNDGPR